MNGYNLSEYIALLFSVLIGSGAFISFVYKENLRKISIAYIVAVLLINLCLTYIADGVLRNLNWGEWRTPILPFVAFAGQYLADWFHKRNPKLFDFAAKKAGVDLNNNQNDSNNENTPENEDQ